MLSKAQKDFIAGMLGVTAEELATGIASETEATFEIPTGKLYSAENIQTLTDNSSKEGYDRGATASREMLLKDMSKKVGFESNSKDAESFIADYKASILKDIDVEPSEKVTELSNTIEELRGKITEKDNEFNEYKGQVEISNRNNKLKGLIPDVSDKIGLNREETLNLFLNQHEITDEGIRKNGEVLYDDLRNPLTSEQAISGWVKEKGWDKVEVKGRLDKKKPNTFTIPKTIDDFHAELAKRNINEGSVEANTLFQSMAKENPEILED